MQAHLRTSLFDLLSITRNERVVGRRLVGSNESHFVNAFGGVEDVPDF